jgi:hypothetical protein
MPCGVAPLFADQAIHTGTSDALDFWVRAKSALATVALAPLELKLAFDSSGLLGPRRLSAAPPTLSELRFQLFTAVSADPRTPGRSRCGPSQCAQRESFVGIIDVELRPCFHHRQIAHGSCKVLIAQLALNSRGYEHVARVSNLQQRCGSVHSLQGI